MTATSVRRTTVTAASAQARARRYTVGRRGPLASVVLWLGVVFFSAFTLYPLLYMVSGSLKTNSEIFTGFASLIPQHLTLTNYHDLLYGNDLEQTNFLLNVRNSLTVAAMTIVLTLVIALPAAFVIARTTNWLTTVVSTWVRIAQVVGGIIVIIPLYLILKEIGLVGTLFGVSLAETVPCSAFAIWVLVTFLRQIPLALEEAARIDGAKDWQILHRIILPLIRPGLFSVLLVVFLLSWNDFLNPLILIDKPSDYTVIVALFTFIGQPGVVNWGALLAYGTLACIPAVAVIALAERHLVRGLVAGSVK